MAKIEPGAYEPRDDIRVFDGADDDVDDEGSRLPLLIVIALLVLAAFAGVVYLAYTEGVQKGRADAPRVITAEPGPAKVAPTDGGGTVTPYKGLKIYEQPAPSDEEADSAPPPPTAVKPQAAPAAAPTPTAAPVIDASSPPPAAPKPAPKATAKADVPAAKAPVAASTTTTKLAMAAPAKSSVTAPAAQPPVATAPPRSLVPAHDTGTVATIKPPKPEAADTAAPTRTAMAEPVPAKAAAKTAVPIVAKPVESKTAEAEPAPVKSGKFVVQLASYPSDADATAAFASMKAKNGGLLGGYSANIKRVDLGAKGVWYRLRVGAFADKEEAAALSAKLGGGSFATRP